MSAIGLAVRASSMEDHFVTTLVGALADRLIAARMMLVTRVVADDAAEDHLYRHWAQVGGVAGVALLGTRPDDARVRRLRTLGYPVAAVVDTLQTDDVPSVVVDLEASVAALRAFLAGRRHGRAVYVVAHEDQDSAPARSVLESTAMGDSFEVVHAPPGVDAAVAAALAALAAGPATLVFHSDVHAAAALSALRARGVRVPDDVAIVSWTNSTLCQSTNPSITAVNRRGAEIGALLGDRMLGALTGDTATIDRAPEPFVVVGETA
ncbi:substrate-binding domain-containing protein [uncultured Cellulomonas sp.]|uniref:substrate-binding domain-containing protein n=1 Tax=uncultured Cellulomonas sp. TaxID=189682 RepID=UPI002617FD7F|nr:substrate-binding domain-containing protein [uncultured Cellulomonas sp.]